MKTARLGTLVALAMPILASTTWFPMTIVAQSGRPQPRHVVHPENDSAQMTGMTDHAMGGPMDENAMKHMALTPYAMPKGARPDRLDPRAPLGVVTDG